MVDIIESSSDIHEYSQVDFLLFPGLAFGRTQPRSGPNPARESQYFGSDRVETSSIRSDIGPKIGQTWDTLDRVRLEPPKSRIGLSDYPVMLICDGNVQ